ncbi:MAG: FtsX-like permease family protein, partial [Verrucomicrobiota bacterium]|nr:FtsX-like permease family protein [Verrucomicrobiota bacterium]
MNLNLNILKTVILRKWIQSPLLPIVLVFIIAVGVATFFSVRLANKSAVSGFKLFTESLTGESDFTIRSPSGLFNEETIIEISKATGNLPVYFYPIIETSALHQGQLIKIVGIDLVSLANFPSISSSSPSIAIDEINDEGINFEKSVFLAEDFLNKNNLSRGEQLKLNQGSSSHTYKIKGTIVNSPFRPTAPSNLVLMDIRECQNFGSLKGKITSIQGFVSEGGLKERVLNQARSILTEWAKSNEFIIESAEDQKKATTEMSSAFRLNLTILSCLALMVGTFFILQSMEASIIRRRGEIAILRSLGIPPTNIFKIWLTESLMIGFIGSLLGVIIGF